MTKPTFQGEVLLRRWSNSSTQGVQVTFALADESDLEPLTAKTGKRFMAVLVEIGDDEQPAEPTAPPGPLCKRAVSLCQSEAFHKYANVRNDYEAGQWLKGQCVVESRKELDTDPEAGRAFRAIETDFAAWRRDA